MDIYKGFERGSRDKQKGEGSRTTSTHLKCVFLICS